MSKKYSIFIVIFFLSITNIFAQQKTWSSSQIKIQLEKLNVLGSVLYFAAHPDDENTRLIAWLAQEKKYRTAYLSLTRGEGGQNLIGTNIGIDLGLIRTNELLAARSIDQGEQFFSSALDFGFSKTHEETFRFWDKRTVLGEAVYIIRKFRPDIIITRFPPDKRGGHGHHQASAILAHEAFVAAADPNQFPEQLKDGLTIWQAKRLVWNASNFGGANNTNESQLKIDIGDYNPLLGQSYGEIAAQSRSQHKSQGFGAAASRGQNIEYFEHVIGQPAKNTLMDEVIASWERIPNAKGIQQRILKINQAFNANHPEKIIPDLFSLKREIQHISDKYWKDQKTREIDQIIIACAGLWVDAVVKKSNYIPDTEIPIDIEAIVRNPNIHITLSEINKKPFNQLLEHNILWRANQKISLKEISQPYWLRQAPAIGKFSVEAADIGKPLNTNKPTVEFVFDINGEKINIVQEVKHRFVDPVRGEIYQPIAILPRVTLELSQNIVLLQKGQAQSVPITFYNNASEQKKHSIQVVAPAGWIVSPTVVDLDFSSSDTLTSSLTIQPTEDATSGSFIHFTSGKDTLKSTQRINYEHIPSITWFPDATIKCNPLELNNPLKRIAYIHGAGDLIPESLRSIGIEVDVLNTSQINTAYLKQFDAVILGIRFFNVQKNSAVVLNRLLDYVHDGGVVLLQYNVNTGIAAQKLGPYPFALSRDRVTEEDAKVVFDKTDPVLLGPNKVTEEDFEHWVQERGLYFASQIDPRYRTPITIGDTGEAPSAGSLLVVSHGKGKFVYTSLSFFRQLPAGVPGAYRLFVNLLAKEK